MIQQFHSWLYIWKKENTNSKRYMHLNVHSSTIYYSQDIKATQVSINRQLEEEEDVGLPWWRSGWESACQCRGHGFKPWSGRIPHAAEQLGPWATIAKPARLGPVLRNKRGRNSERPAHRDEGWPLLATTRESPHTETKTQHSHE